MKLLIVSDIHGQLDILERVIRKHSDIKVIICAGDLMLDIKTVESLHMIAVKGNGDYYLDLPLERVFVIDNKKILLSHGHADNVKYGLGSLLNKAIKVKADICIFGHTHERYLSILNNILFINPGALSGLLHYYAIYDNGEVTFHEL